MNKFKLMNEPLSFQLSVRISNLISTYGSAVVREHLTWTLKENSKKNPQMRYDDQTLKFGMFALVNDPDLALHIHTTQIVRYFGPKFVKAYWNEVYTSKVA